MTVFRRRLSGVLTTSTGTSPADLEVLDAAVTLDEGWAPYAQADMVVKLPDMATQARITDLSTRSRVRLIVETLPPLGTVGQASTFRTFDLGIIARQVNVRAGTIGLSLASDESLLQDYAHTGLTSDMGLRPLQLSVRNMVNYVLTKALGRTTAVLETNDYQFPTYVAARNLWAYRPSGAGLIFQGVNATVSSSDRFNVAPANTNNDSYGFVDMNLQAGKTYTMSADVQQTVVQSGTLNGRARRLVIVTTASGITRVHAMSPQAPNVVGINRISFTFTMPDNLASSTIRLYAGGTSGTGQVAFRDVLILEGNGLNELGNPIQYFDGDNAATTAYTYAWDGDPYTSTSTRTPRINRSPEVLIWNPGETAWDLLKPIMEATGFRLWCDEMRVWHMTGPTWSLGGTVTAHAGANLYDAIDLVSRSASQSSGVPLYVDAVIVRYTWIDEKGNDRERFDIATTSGFIKPFMVERPETPFPGAGAATYLLRRYMQRRRQVPVTRAMDLTVSPGMAVTIKVGDGSTLTGYLDAVTFDFHEDEMSLKTKDLA